MPWFPVSIDTRLDEEDHPSGYIFVSDENLKIVEANFEGLFNRVINRMKTYCEQLNHPPFFFPIDHTDMHQLSCLARRLGVWGWDSDRIFAKLADNMRCVRFYVFNGDVFAEYNCSHTSHPKIYD